MKCINRTLSILIMVSLLICTLCACQNVGYDYPYERNMVSSAYMITDTSMNHETLDSFAKDLCVNANADVNKVATSLNATHASGLFDLNNKEVLYATNQFEQMPPASVTKILTALVALKYGDLDEEIHVSGNCKITESGAVLLGIQEGDIMTLDQALNVLLLYSANDVALAIAEHVGGTQENFIEMMNEEALRLGATNSHFMNPHGLTQDEHYTTIYDLYLIFNEVIQYERFREIIQQTNYTTVYYDSQRNPKEVELRTTNQYLAENVTAPENITVLGGKTGTTNAARNCLILYAKDSAGNPYISVILRAETRDDLYADMNRLLEVIQ